MSGHMSDIDGRSWWVLSLLDQGLRRLPAAMVSSMYLYGMVRIGWLRLRKHDAQHVFLYTGHRTLEEGASIAVEVPRFSRTAVSAIPDLSCHY